jgi:hypothetical protein
VKLKNSESCQKGSRLTDRRQGKTNRLNQRIRLELPSFPWGSRQLKGRSTSPRRASDRPLRQRAAAVGLRRRALQTAQSANAVSSLTFAVAWRLRWRRSPARRARTAWGRRRSARSVRLRCGSVQTTLRSPERPLVGPAHRLAGDGVEADLLSLLQAMLLLRRCIAASGAVG